MCPDPAAPSDRTPVSDSAVPSGQPARLTRKPAGLPDDALPAGLLDALRSDLTAAARRRQQVERARQRVRHVQLDDAELLECIVSSLLAARIDTRSQ